MPDIRNAITAFARLSPLFAEALYDELVGNPLAGQPYAVREFVTAYERHIAVAAETHDADLADDHRTCDGSCAEPTCRNGMPLLTPTAPTTIAGKGMCPVCGRALVGYDGPGRCPSPFCPGPRQTDFVPPDPDRNA